jgi:hypothetical protein
VQKAVTAKDVDAISASDVLAALKIVHGRDPNPDPDGIGPGNRREISQYQYHSADFNHDGIVNETDVHGILKTAISSSSMQPDSIKWKFFDSSFSTIGISRSNVPDVPMLRPGDLTSPIQLIGVLLGDVDGSWGAQP